MDFDAVRKKVMTNPKETRLPDFLALNHRGKTPLFVDIMPSTTDGIEESSYQTITVNESLAILQYIETYHGPGIPLLPPLTSRAERGLVLARIQETENLHNTYDALEDAHFSAAHEGQPFRPVDRAALAEPVENELDFWETYAQKTDFIAGNTFSLADCAFFPLLGYMVHRGFDWQRVNLLRHDDITWQNRSSDTDWPNLRRYFHRVWHRDGEQGCAQRAQPEGWDRPGRENVWRGPRNGRI